MVCSFQCGEQVWHTEYRREARAPEFKGDLARPSPAHVLPPLWDNRLPPPPGESGEGSSREAELTPREEAGEGLGTGCATL